MRRGHESWVLHPAAAARHQRDLCSSRWGAFPEVVLLLCLLSGNANSRLRRRLLNRGWAKQARTTARHLGLMQEFGHAHDMTLR
jgi:hypothetical protein